jgi:hypothetical protein
MQALAAGKPIIARDLPVYREIAASCPEGANIHLCRDSAALIRTVTEARPAWTDERRPVEAISWKRSAEGIARVAEAAFAAHGHAAARERFTPTLTSRLAVERHGRRVNRLAKSLGKRYDALAALLDPFLNRS